MCIRDSPSTEQVLCPRGVEYLVPLRESSYARRIVGPSTGVNLYVPHSYQSGRYAESEHDGGRAPIQPGGPDEHAPGDRRVSRVGKGRDRSPYVVRRKSVTRGRCAQ